MPKITKLTNTAASICREVIQPGCKACNANSPKQTPSKSE